MKKLIIFDLDGVLFDSSRIAYEGVRGIFPTLTDDIMNEILCGNFHEEIKKLTLPRVKETEEEQKVRRTQYLERKIQAPLFFGIKELLCDIKKNGSLLGLNTSARRDNCVSLLTREEIYTFFDYIGTMDEGESKAEKFRIMLNTFGTTPEESIFVTDTLGDLREADIVGIPTIAVTYGAHSREFFTREPHANLVAIVDTVGELRDAITSV